MDKENLLNALKLTRPALGNTNLIPGLDCFFFEGQTITAFNGSLEVTSTVEELPITGAVQGEVLFKLINELGKEIELLSPQPDTLIVRSGRSKTTFPVKDINTDFLKDVEEEGQKIYLPVSILFAAGLKRCMLSMGGKAIDNTEIGVHVFLEGHECKMYSTNGQTFSRFAFPLENATETNNIFLPAAFVENLLFLYSEIGVSPIEIVVSEKYVRARFENTTLRASFYSNPVNTDLQELIDGGIEEVALVDLPKEFSEAIKRSEIVSGNTPILIEFGDPESNKVYITATGQGKQESFEEVELAYPSAGSINVDMKGVRKVVDSCKSIGFGKDYMLFVGSEDFFVYIIAGRSQ